MKKIVNECVSCDIPCMGSGCPNRAVTRYVCDHCGEEETLYLYEGEELCVSCILKQLEQVEGSDY